MNRSIWRTTYLCMCRSQWQLLTCVTSTLEASRINFLRLMRLLLGFDIIVSKVRHHRVESDFDTVMSKMPTSKFDWMYDLVSNWMVQWLSTNVQMECPQSGRRSHSKLHSENLTESNADIKLPTTEGNRFDMMTNIVSCRPSQLRNSQCRQGRKQVMRLGCY